MRGMSGGESATAVEPSRAWGRTLRTERIGTRVVSAFWPRRHHLAELFLDAAPLGRQLFLVSGDREVTYAQYLEAVDAGARRLRVEHGVGNGDRVMLLGGNSPEWVVAFGSIVRAGGTVVLGNAWWTPAEVAHGRDLVGAKLVLCDERRRRAVPHDAPVVDLNEIADDAERGDGDVLPVGTRAMPSEDDPAVVLFTSGTTGPAKGVVLSHRATIATVHAALVASGREPAAAKPGQPIASALLSMPTFHVGGLMQIINPLVRGTTLVFHEGRFDPGQVLDTIERRSIVAWTAVPTMASRVLDHLDATSRPGPTCLRTVSLGGSAVPQELRRRMAQHFPNLARRAMVSYGLSESGGLAVSGSIGELADRPGSIGRPLPSVEARAVRSDGGTGSGELQLRSPALMSGYALASPPGGPLLCEPGPIDAAGWLRTGDLGSVDADGFVYITGRSKDVVIRGGENVSAGNVEEHLLQHPSVREAAVLGLPHESLGEEVAAVVVVDPPVTELELIEHLRARVAYFAVPTKWWITTVPLPLGATGKVVKRELRDAWPTHGNFLMRSKESS